MQNTIRRKPEWLRKKITPSSHKAMEALMGERHLHTVCEEAICPNISECFRQKVATFMILGALCTRACTFCAVSKGRPAAPDAQEPENVAQAVRRLGLRHVVITSVTRDDLNDGGAAHFCETVRAVKALDESIVVELLIPDLKENQAALEAVARSGAEIIGHNVETVPRLYHVRKGADYERSLRVLKMLSDTNPAVATKSGIMLGLGEREEEVLALMRDLLDVGCRYLSIGQYLAPASGYAEVVEYLPPERFEFFRSAGMEMGFDYIKSSPYTRSSYMAHEYRKRSDNKEA
ncbi:lipoyl synthase [Sulfurimonas sp. HSL3-7]|uniref:lipoyl synthase n=1 Tax=Sulfonitrofixus jiaomeiensis TaxID=3131938 RepID=UPI0031F90C59